MAEKKIALFIDADNISAKFGKQIIATLENRGEIFIRRIYGNWEKPSLHGWNDCIRDFALRPVQQTDFVSGKNATDMSLTIDAMDVLHRDNAEIFALVTNDSDFTPLVIRLREGGMKIIGIGNANASNAFRAACSEFIDLGTLAEGNPAQPLPVTEKISPVTEKILPAPVKPPVVKKKSAVQLSLFDDFNVEHEPPPVTANPKVISLDERKLQSERDKNIQLMHDALQDSARLHANAEGFSSLNHARQYVRNKNFSFTVHDFGFGQLKDFIAAYPKLYETRQGDNGQNFFYRCRTNDAPAPIVDSDKLNRLHEVLRKAVATHADDTGFADLCYVGSHIAKQNLGFGVKDLGYSSLQKFLAAFPNLYDLRIDDNKTYLRCRNELEQLHEVLRQTAALHEDSDGFVNLWWACDFISGKKNLVNEIKSMTYKDLLEFLGDFPDRYEIRHEPGQDLCYRSRAIKPKPAENNRLQQLHKILRETAQGNRDKSGFVDLTCAGQNIHDKNFSMKGLGYGSLSKFVSAFPKLYEMRTVGKIVRYRCRR